MLWPKTAPLIALTLAAAALLLFALAPLGWRAGWWHYRFGLYWLMPLTGVVGAIAAILSAAALVAGRLDLEPRHIAMACAAFVLGAVVAYVPLQYRITRNTLPRIHDITTDTEDPPLFAAVMAARRAENSGTVDYGGLRHAKLQKASYPDVAPFVTTLPAPKAFELALAVANAMPGWTIVASEPAAGRIEASHRSRWFGFTDDIVIRVVANGAGSRIDMRSTSRQGRSDFGVNAARIRAYMGALRTRLVQSP